MRDSQWHYLFHLREINRMFRYENTELNVTSENTETYARKQKTYIESNV